MIFARVVLPGDCRSDLGFLVELRGFEPLTPSMRMRIWRSNGFQSTSDSPVKCQLECQVMVLERVA